MKATIPLLAGLSLLLVSCAAFDPEYAEYKEQKKAQEAAPAPYGAASDPYGAAAANPYGVPSGASEVGSYTPSRSSSSPPPYQPLPGVPNDPLPPVRVSPNSNISSYPTIPSPSAPAPSAGTTTPYTVVKGDTLWGISQRHGTTIEALKQANGLTSDTIRVGQTLNIPGN